MEFVIDGRVDGIMPCGTTGETALLRDDEVLEVVAGVGVLVSDPFELLAFELGELDGVGGVCDVEVKHVPDERWSAPASVDRGGLGGL